MSEARASRAEQFVRERQAEGTDYSAIAVAHFARFAEAEVRAAVTEFVAKVNARAEADMLAGNPITGAHHRALIVELAALQPARGAREGTG